MKYFELKCKAYLKKDIDFKASFEAISRFVSFCLMQDEYTEEIHKKRGFKHYAFGSFFKVEEDKVYKKDKTYDFTLRTPDEKMAQILQKTLRANINNPYFLVLQTTVKEIKRFFITELYTATPTIVSVENAKLYWSIDKDGDILKLQRLLHENLEKKYKDFYQEDITPNQNFIQLLELKNKKPQTIVFHKENRPIVLFGNKFKIIPHEDDISQKLAFMALSSGLGEKNSFGGGFCIAKGIER